jgi:hypothetical protein
MSSEAERKTYLNEHLGYEMFMLRYTAQTLPQRHQQLEWNICVESFAVHARVLYEFLTNDTISQNFRARDYVRDFKAPKTNDTIGIFDRVHRQVLHLAKNRSSEAAGKIILADVEKAKQWIEDHFKIFIGSLEEPYRSCWDEHAATPPQNGLSLMFTASGEPSSTSSITSSISSTSSTSIVSEGSFRFPLPEPFRDAGADGAQGDDANDEGPPKE